MRWGRRRVGEQRLTCLRLWLLLLLLLDAVAEKRRRF